MIAFIKNWIFGTGFILGSAISGSVVFVALPCEEAVLLEESKVVEESEVVDDVYSEHSDIWREKFRDEEGNSSGMVPRGQGH